MMPLSELDALVGRFRAGEVYEPSSDPESADWLHVIAPIVSMAAADLENQLERLDEFSLPLLPPTSLDVQTQPTRTHPAKTAQLFLSQLRSDFRCVAGPHINLVEIEEQRHRPEWEAAFEKHGIKNRSVAVLAVGRYLDFGHTQDGLVDGLEPWLRVGDDGNIEWSQTNLGPVVGPLVQRALVLSGPLALPSWARQYGRDWSIEFLVAGAQELLRARTTGDYGAQAEYHLHNYYESEYPS